jgi:tetratricopeptide (TPR) repeat protein
MRKYGLLALVGLTLVTLSLVAHFAAAQDSTNAPAASTRDRLQQLTAQLQQSPGDQALREKIIALALTLNPKPATPDGATMAEGAAEYVSKNAKTTSDYSDAAKQYEKALLLAPWLAADYFDCGVAHEKAGETNDAIRNFKLYLLAAPNADDAQAIKKRVGGLQYAAQKTEDEANRAAREAVAKQAAAPPVPVIERYECPTPQNERTVSQSFSFDFSTHTVTQTTVWEHNSLDFHFQFEESGQLLVVREGCNYGERPLGCKAINRTTRRLAMYAWGRNGGEDAPRGVHTGGPYVVEYSCPAGS